MLAAAVGNLGDVAINEGDLDRSEQLLVEAVELAREAVDPDDESASLFTLARARLIRGDLDAARATLIDALAVAGELGYPEILAYCVTLAAELLAPDAPEPAATLAGAGAASFGRLGIRMQRLEHEAHERTLASLGVRLGPRLDGLLERGRALDLGEAAAIARTLLEAASASGADGPTSVGNPCRTASPAGQPPNEPREPRPVRDVARPVEDAVVPALPPAPTSPG